MTARRLPALMLLAAAACSPDPGSPDALTRERFVAANVALRAVSDTLPGADSLRVAALKKAGVTAPQLRGWVRSHRRDTELLAAVWKEIADSLQRRDSIAIAQRPPEAVKPEPPAGMLPPPAPDSDRLPGRPESQAPAPVRVEPPRARTKTLEVREAMPIEPDSGDAPAR